MANLSILVGTSEGLSVARDESIVQVEQLAGRAITALACEGPTRWALVDGQSLWRSIDGERWSQVAQADSADATCLSPAPSGLLLGTEGARLLRLENNALVGLQSFDHVEGRDAWYTPWGDPADTRSISVAPSGAIYVNVHVGGVVRSRDDGRSWRPTLDIEADVHQVLAHPRRPGIVFAAAAVGLGISLDGGDSWRFETEGLHATYLRGVAMADDTVLVSASTGPSGRRAAIYRKRLDRSGRREDAGGRYGGGAGRSGDAGTRVSDGDAEMGDAGGRSGEDAGGRFERCRQGLPDWFHGNIDTGCLAASGATVVFGTEDGAVYRSTDAGERWQTVAKGLPQVTCVVTA
jgi:hypothetical protein